MTKVLLAEDDPLTLSGIKLLLAKTNYKIVSAVTSGEEVLEQLPTARPDMLILDVDMPGRTGLDILRILRSRGSDCPIVLLTGRIDDRKATEAIQLAVNGLVMKSAAPNDLIPCLDSVVQGRRWVDREVLQRAMDYTLSKDKDDPLKILSPRERGIAALVQQGFRNKEIATELGLTEGTVKVHLHKIFDKLGIRSRTELILLCR
ncbi:response regulator transcription factor [Allosphingosinicella flava]|uniref:Response regulator transcription factor n=1 Tax=Allosphingosinicella flava TaxID=2771430 RepID=A0A7T2GLF8_9SPHN|nr:response regulator transcription factor [Sphingosinicella flava]QPQ56040.1 response regulator transcription factor [Sphingosinicella flava]